VLDITEACERFSGAANPVTYAFTTSMLTGSGFATAADSATAGCGTKDCCVQCTATTHSHDHHVGLCFKGELNDPLVWLADSYYHLDDAFLARFARNGFLQLF
jgi:hypothetical protein